MFIPLGDENRPGGGPYFVTWTLIALNVLVFIMELSLGDEFIYGYSTVPAEITQGQDIEDFRIKTRSGDPYRINYPGPTPIYLTLLTSMFMHGGWAHLIGNMLYLWIFGDNLEDVMGHRRFTLYYLLCGLAASFAHIATDPNSMIPSLGASGAISGVLGGYILLFPRNQIRVIMGHFVTTMPAIVVLGLWIVLQFVSGVGAIAVTRQTGGGVAYWAHIGGFVAGVALVFVFRKKGAERRPLSIRERYR